MPLYFTQPAESNMHHIDIQGTGSSGLATPHVLWILFKLTSCPNLGLLRVHVYMLCTSMHTHPYTQNKHIQSTKRGGTTTLKKTEQNV